jgi:hypothetical protein
VIGVAQRQAVETARCEDLGDIAETVGMHLNEAMDVASRFSMPAQGAPALRSGECVGTQ